MNKKVRMHGLCIKLTDYAGIFYLPDSQKSVTTIQISYNTVVLYSRDRYEIIGLRKSSHSIKQPCSSICLKKAFAMHQSC